MNSNKVLLEVKKHNDACKEIVKKLEQEGKRSPTAEESQQLVEHVRRATELVEQHTIWMAKQLKKH